jgi:H+/Cl- antiporter ClcA
MESKKSSSGFISFICSIVGFIGFFLFSYVAVGVGIYAIVQDDKRSLNDRPTIWAVLGVFLGGCGVLVNIGRHFLS